MEGNDTNKMIGIMFDTIRGEETHEFIESIYEQWIKKRKLSSKQINALEAFYLNTKEVRSWIG